jgi:hypothetical protein
MAAMAEIVIAIVTEAIATAVDSVPVSLTPTSSF